FGALLSGDAEALRRHYTVESEGDAQRWVLRLVPRDDRLAAKLRELRLHGRGDELRCIENAAVQGEVQRTLMGAAAEAARRGGAGVAGGPGCAASGPPRSRARCGAR